MKGCTLSRFFHKFLNTCHTICFLDFCASFRYQQITKKLRAVVWKVNQPEPNPTFWKDIREDYNRICVLGCDIENIITNLIFVSYACNLLLSLVYLRYITVIPGFTTEKVYNIVCFAVYATKMFLTSVYLSKVNVTSLEASIPLNSVSTRQYNVEIQRLLQQINGNCVAFTGNKVFRVTRHIVLHIFAIMLTYELVLVQFSQLNFHIH
ncbi:gustatory receptor for sugar taste 64f-like isoform X2 [Photinus pyralis]|uniref:gustatory receptor for sugar taste 64f-like isoform X2 n=1 Tax=Photinus pyralis TaxID=7054 RepID=UPI0012670F16|nr:gustatory receptor for sugar taste 64f-like isoform X2 [Photinus pyralis]